MHSYRTGGWTDKYIITKADGTPVDPAAVYFVLRLDADPHAREAMREYSRSVRPENGMLADDIDAKLIKTADVYIRNRRARP